MQPVSSAGRYQRFLEKQLGQLLQAQALGLTGASQPSERQLDRLCSSTKGQGTSQLSERQPNRDTSSTKRQTRGPAQDSFPGPHGQLLQAQGQVSLRDGQSRSSKGSSGRHSHVSNQNFSQSEHWQLQRAQTHSQPSVNQQLSRNNGMHSALTLKSQAHEQRCPSGNGVQPASMGMLPLAGDERGPKQHTSDPRNHGGELRQPQMTQQKLSRMRGVSPHRRQLLLQARLALFDSDSSSSDEEDGSVQKVSQSRVTSTNLRISAPQCSQTSEGTSRATNACIILGLAGSCR